MSCLGHCNQGRSLCCTPAECGLVTHNSDGSDPHRNSDFRAFAFALALMLAATVSGVIWSLS